MDKSEPAAERCGVPQELALREAGVWQVQDGHLHVNMGGQTLPAPTSKCRLAPKIATDCPKRMHRQCQPAELALRGKRLLLKLGWKEKEGMELCLYRQG